MAVNFRGWTKNLLSLLTKPQSLHNMHCRLGTREAAHAPGSWQTPASFSAVCVPAASTWLTTEPCTEAPAGAVGKPPSGQGAIYWAVELGRHENQGARLLCFNIYFTLWGVTVPHSPSTAGITSSFHRTPRSVGLQGRNITPTCVNVPFFLPQMH